MINTPMAIRRPDPNLWSLSTKLILALGIGLTFFFLVVLLFILGFNSLYQGRIYPGVTVGSVDLTSQSINQAIPVLRQKLTYAESGHIVLQDGDKVWLATPAQLGFFLDPENSVISAYSVGRQGNLFKRMADTLQAVSGGRHLSPLMIFDERSTYAYLDQVAKEINQPVSEASLKINGTQVDVLPGQIGRSLDIDASLKAIETRLLTMTDGVIPLIVKEQPPAILDASQQAEIARRILSQAINLRIENAQKGDPGPWQLNQQEIAAMLAIQRVQTTQGASYQVGLQEASLKSYLDKLSKEINRIPANARFIFNDDSRQLELIQPAANGQTLNVEASLKLIQQKVLAGEHEINLVVEIKKPAIEDNVTAKSLGIRELVSSYTSYFYGSSKERIQNIKTAAGRFHGVLVAPGATFSMGEILGDVSLDNGYAEALIIYGNRTIKGVGGGVCQVSTTLFRTAFFGGYPIEERHPHAYRVTYYEETRSGGINTDLAGLDATVFVPVVDFKFTNDTPNWILMETYVNEAARWLTWKFYSTSDGRKVEWDTSGLQNVVEPDEPVVQENSDLGKNEIRQTDWAVEGADVTVTRTVTRNGEVYIQDQYVTHYLPWRAVYEYGPETDAQKLADYIAEHSQ